MCLGKELKSISRMSLNSEKIAELLERGQVRSLYNLITSRIPEKAYTSGSRLLIHGLLHALVEMREKGEQTLSFHLMRHYLTSFPAVHELVNRTDLSQKSRMALHNALKALSWNQDRFADMQGTYFKNEFNRSAQPCLVALNEIEFFLDGDARGEIRDSPMHRCMRRHPEGREGDQKNSPVSCGVMILGRRQEEENPGNDFRKSLQSVVETLQHAINCMDGHK